MKLILVFFISLAFCSDDEKYTFIFGDFDVGKKMIYKYSLETSFTVPGIGLIKYMEEYIETLEFLGVEEDFWKFKATLTDMESDNYVNELEIMDYFREAMENNPCYLYVGGFERMAADKDSWGRVDHIVPVDPEDDYLQEAYRAAYMNMYPINLRYPFDYKAVNVTVGDSWMDDYKKSTIYVNMGSPPSQAMSKTTWTLKKVKNKKGRKIAIIEMQDSLILDLQILLDFQGKRRLITGQATGVSDVVYNWDIDPGEMLKTTSVTHLKGNFEMDDKKFYMKIFMRNISKMVK